MNVKVLVCAFGVALVACATCAGVYDDALVWWHFDYDANNDDLAQVDEIRDQLDWGTASQKGANGKHATTITSQKGALA